VVNYIQKLIAQGEHQHLDFKFTISDACHIAESFTAFANATGGKLLVGVKDNGAIAGVRTDEELYMLNAAASYYCSPPVPYSVRAWDCRRKTVLEVNIPEGKRKPYYVKRKNNQPPVAYIRIADNNVKVCNIQLMVWKKQKNPSGLCIMDTENIGWLLTYLEKYPYISILTVSRQLMISYKMAVRLLADLVYLDFLEIDYQNNKVWFRVKRKT